MEIQIDDVRIRLPQCTHCGVQPNEADAVQAIANYKKTWGHWTCALCNQGILPTCYIIIHTSGEGGEVRWFARPEPRIPEALIIRPAGRQTTVAGFLHPSCARRALPHLPLKVLEMAEEAERDLAERAHRFVQALNQACGESGSGPMWDPPTQP